MYWKGEAQFPKVNTQHRKQSMKLFLYHLDFSLREKSEFEQPFYLLNVSSKMNLKML